MLLSGEALFKVHRDPARPFEVLTPEAVIQAVGTEFNVYRRTEGTTVAVLEGRVKVVGDSHSGEGRTETSQAHAESELTPHFESLGSGQQARIDHSGQIATQPVQDMASVAAWRERRLIFAGTPLRDVIAEFNRYNRSPQFVLVGEDASQRTYSGVFDADDPDSLIQLLQREPAMQLQRQGDRVVIRVQTAVDAHQ